MKCSKIERLFFDYITDRLDKGQALAVKNHIDSCKDCRAQFEAFQKTIEVLDQWELPELPVQAAERLADHIFESESQPGIIERIDLKKLIRKLIPPIRFYIPVQAMAAIIVAVSIILVYNQSKQPGINDRIPRELTIETEIRQVATPLTLRVKNMDQALEDIVLLIRQSEGRLFRRIPEEGSLTVVFWVSPENEPIFFKRLKTKGYAVTMNKNYKDETGNLHLQLKEKE